MTEFAPGLHAAIGKDVDVSAYDRFTGRWSRLFVPDVIAAADIGLRVQGPGYLHRNRRSRRRGTARYWRLGHLGRG